MKHWAGQYIGKPYTSRQDCYYWFREISRKQFGRDLPPIILSPVNRTLKAARLMNGEKEYFGYKPTDKPEEGDAVFMSGNGRTAHHLGMVVLPDTTGKIVILHALEGVGLVASDLQTLKINNLKITGFWKYENIT